MHLMKRRESVLVPLVHALSEVSDGLVRCETCGNIDLVNPCRICSDPKRGDESLCVVADVADLWALERGRLFPGRYHVLGGVLSALDGVGPDALDIDGLLARLTASPEISEVVLAMSATLEGQTTAHYVADRLAERGVKVTQLAHGMPVGGELDYMDEGTLEQALRLRRPL